MIIKKKKKKDVCKNHDCGSLSRNNLWTLKTKKNILLYC